MDIKEIRLLIELMRKNGLAVFKMEREGFKITLKTSEATSTITSQNIPQLPPTPPPTPSDHTPTPADVAIYREITAPMVGTFYVAPSPGAQPFVNVGQVVTPDTVVCIIEAMKVMNEIKAEVSGTIVEICAENGKPVQFGQTLFRVK